MFGRKKNMLWKEVLILDCPEIQCPPVLRIVFWEFCGAFRRRNQSVRVIETLQEIHEEAIVFMGDFIHVDNPCFLLSKIARNAIYVGWYWHHQPDISLLPYFLHIYENVLSSTLSPDKEKVVEFMRQHVSCPLLLRADEDPKQIGTYPRQTRYDYCFMGGRMCEWMVPSGRFQGIYHGVHDTRQYLSYEERRGRYLSSIFALGFQTDENIRNGHVSQRIFEAMAYGCIVLSNSLHASIQTDGIVEYIEDKGSLERRMDFFLQNPHYIQKKQQQGYEFARNYGTNEYAISLLLKAMEKHEKKQFS